MNWISSLRFSRQCPIDTMFGFNLYSPQGLLYSALGEERGDIAFTPKLIDALYHCTLCGACDSRCKRNLDIEVLQVIETLRIRCVEKGHTIESHKKMVENIRQTGNEYGKPVDRRMDWLTADIKPLQSAEILYFVGCNSAYKHREIARSTARLLQRMGIPFMLLAAEKCSGNEILSIGYTRLARDLAEQNLDAIQKSGAKKIVTSSAECYKSLKVDYPKIFNKSTDEMPYKVQHITELVDDLLKAKQLEFHGELPLKVTYHDSCNLGRLSEEWQVWIPKYDGTVPVGKKWRRGDRGVYDQPRNILNSIPGLILVEMERNRSNAWCVGGGGVEKAFPDFALWTALERIEEANAVGARLIVTTSPSEKELLDKAARLKKTDLQVRDITEIMIDVL
jgi:Fe-S oxidoreductase